MSVYMTDEELLQYIRTAAAELGRVPKKSEVSCALQIKSRFGPWPRALELAGVKVPSERSRQRQERKKEKRMRQRINHEEKRRRLRTEKEAMEKEQDSGGT